MLPKVARRIASQGLEVFSTPHGRTREHGVAEVAWWLILVLIDVVQDELGSDIHVACSGNEEIEESLGCRGGRVPFAVILDEIFGKRVRGWRELSNQMLELLLSRFPYAHAAMVTAHEQNR